ncbi:GNAT family N-acetyltransferase [Algimonas porphyrae]|uniref:N-acetyltransferase domain-containing protein n=1 Tax=Algimonas porphyrae TaxID=1128113 RepID=A0ABQ5V356_9PROT|nr:GNAT family N-acetyltransferase [Algimonas porphyrae]GLQ21971.1 hypothetical protein GCM10007854_29260 [Algimonas porphyrae]
MKIVPLAEADLDCTARLTLGRLNVLAYPEFYNGLGLEGEALDRLSADMFDVSEGELSDTIVAISDEDTLCGYLSALPSDDFRAAASRTAFAVLKGVARDQRKPVMAHMQAIGAGQDALPANTHYLARIAVSPDWQGKGIAAELMDIFEAQGGGCDHVLHVAADNARAIRFYEKRGYETESGSDSTLLMRRRASS